MLAFIWRIWGILRKLKMVGVLGKIKTENLRNMCLLSHIHCTTVDLEYTGNNLQMNNLQFWIHQWCSKFIYSIIKSVAHKINYGELEKHKLFFYVCILRVLNVVLEKDGDQLALLCEKWSNITIKSRRKGTSYLQ